MYTKKEKIAIFFLKDVKVGKKIDISQREDKQEVIHIIKELINQGFPLHINGEIILKTNTNNPIIENLYDKLRIEKSSPYR